VLYEIKKHLPKRNKEDPKKKGKNNNKREPTLNQETRPKETTPKIAIAQPGATKEREREQWNELFWRFFICSFLSFLV
jgi:hypothetical protein